MILNGQYGLHRRLLIAAVVTTLVITLVLVAGQFSQLAPTLGGISWLKWLSFVPPTSVVMLEAILPIAALFASAMSYGFWGRQGLLIAYQGSGRCPAYVFIPAMTLGVLLSVCTSLLAHAWGPSQLRALKREVQTAWLGQAKSGGMNLTAGELVSRQESSDDGGRYWFSLPGDGRGPPILGSADTLHLEWHDDEPKVRLLGTHIWSEDARFETQAFTLTLDPLILNERLRMLGPPNSLSSEQLELDVTHHAFIFQKRCSMSSLALLWSFFGALVGLTFGPLIGFLGSSGLIAVSYWVLRSGELAARHGEYSVVLAAWGPVFVSGVAVLGLLWLWKRRI